LEIVGELIMAEKEFGRDQERLAKLWDAYETQERELDLAMKKISDLESKIKEHERINSTLKKVAEGRDKEIRDLEVKIVALEEDKNRYMPRIDELNELYREEKERYAKLFIITEELEEELALAKKELEIRDSWFKNNIGILSNLSKSIIDRDNMVKEITSKKLEIPPPEPEKVSFETLTPSKEPDKVTFEKMTGTANDADEDTVTFEKATPDSGPVSPSSEVSKSEVIEQFTQVEDITTEHAELLYNEGFTSIEKLKSATTEELAKVDGISPTLARKIRTALI
jgi:hypothetical protein